MCGGGGAGGSGTQKYEWNDNIAPFWQSSLDLGNALRQQPQQVFHGQTGQYGQAYNGGLTQPGQKIADLNSDQQNAINNMRGYTSDPTYGVMDPNQAQNAGIKQETNTLNGGYLNSDPYATAQNPYGGLDNPYFSGVLAQGLNDMNTAYQQGTAADTTRMFNQAGAFGGSAYQNAVGMNENALAKQQGQYLSGMQNDQYNRSAQLAQQQAQLGSQAYQNERNRQMQAVGNAQGEQGLALQRGNALMGIGDVQRGYNQDLINQNLNDFQTQQQYPFQMADWFSGLLGRAQGGMSPNMTFSPASYQASPFSQVMGAGLLGYGLTH